MLNNQTGEINNISGNQTEGSKKTVEDILIEIFKEIRKSQQRWMNTKEAANYIGYEKRKIYYLVRNGKLPFVRLSDDEGLGGYRFDRQDLDKMMLDNKIDFSKSSKLILQKLNEGKIYGSH